MYRPTLADFTHKITLSKSRKDVFKALIRCKRIKDKDSDLGVYDTTDKIYNPQKVCGFTCQLEPGVLEQTPGLLDALTIDLDMLRCLLPPKALMQLQISTPLWINTSMRYGPVGSPADNSMCFHPTDGQVSGIDITHTFGTFFILILYSICAKTIEIMMHYMQILTNLMRTLLHFKEMALQHGNETG